MTAPALKPADRPMYRRGDVYDFPIGVRKVARPKMKDHAGRTWDQCDVLLPDGRKIVGHLDTTWGTRFYFNPGGWGQPWYAASIDAFALRGQGSALVFCLRAERDGVRIGDTVRLACNALAGEAKVTTFYDTPGGVRVEPALDDFNSWNVDDLTVVARSERG